ncbi:MAG: hypothetical protein ACP5NY_04140 [Thermocladium sp.]
MKAREQVIAAGLIGSLIRAARGATYTANFTIAAHFLGNNGEGRHHVFNELMRLAGGREGLSRSSGRMHFTFTSGDEAWRAALRGEWAEFLASKAMTRIINVNMRGEVSEELLGELRSRGVLGGSEIQRILRLTDGSAWRIKAMRLAASGEAEALQLGSLVLVINPARDTLIKLLRRGALLAPA